MIESYNRLVNEYIKKEQMGLKHQINPINLLEDTHFFVVVDDFITKSNTRVSSNLGLPFNTCYFDFSCMNDKDTYTTPLGIFVTEIEPNNFVLQVLQDMPVTSREELDSVMKKELAQQGSLSKLYGSDLYNDIIDSMLKDSPIVMTEYSVKIDIQTGEVESSVLTDPTSNVIGYKYDEKPIKERVVATFVVLLSYIANRQLTLAENTEQIKVRTRIKGKFIKKKYKPNYLIYIGSEKQVTTHKPQAKIIREHNFAWEVRGFWRQLAHGQKIGHDRTGSIITNGFTWVKPHTRGEGEIIKKVRVYK